MSQQHNNDGSGVNPAAVSIHDVDLDNRSWNCLQRAGFETLGEVAARTADQLLLIRNFGEESLREVQRVLGEHGLSLADAEQSAFATPQQENWAQTLRPMRWLSEYSRLYPDAWKKMAAFHAAPPGGEVWPNWCYCPLAGAYAVVSGGSNEPITQAQGADIAAIGALAAWRLTKGIYRLHPQTLAALRETSMDGNIPSEILFRLPEWCIYVELPAQEYEGIDGTIHGFWAHLEYDANTSRRELRFLLDTDNPTPHGLVIHLGGTIMEGFKSSSLLGLQNAGASPSQAEAIFESGKGIMQELALPLVSIVLYICTAVPDTPQRDVFGEAQAAPPSYPQPNKKGQIIAPAQPQWWRVGYRMGQALRGAMAQADRQRKFQSRDRREGITVSPHVRKSHWHLYYTGEGSKSDPAKRVPKLKWLPPIPVNVKDYDELPATIRPVR